MKIESGIANIHPIKAMDTQRYKRIATTINGSMIDITTIL